MKRNELIKRINEEYEIFKSDILNKSKEEIFERSDEINFKKNMREYLLNEDNELTDNTIENLSEINSAILDELYEVYLNTDTYYTFETFAKKSLATTKKIMTKVNIKDKISVGYNL